MFSRRPNLFAEAKEVEKEIGFADVTGEIELPNKKIKEKKKKPVQGKGQPGSGQGRALQDGENRGARNEGTQTEKIAKTEKPAKSTK